MQNSLHFDTEYKNVDLRAGSPDEFEVFHQIQSVRLLQRAQFAQWVIKQRNVRILNSNRPHVVN
jgi:hypothetical protein